LFDDPRPYFPDNHTKNPMTATTQSHHGINPKTHPKNIGTSQIPKPTAVIQNRVGKPHSTHKFGFTGPSRGGGTTATATGGGATGARGVGAGMGGGVGISLTAGARAGETSLRPRFRGGLSRPEPQAGHAVSESAANVPHATHSSVAAPGLPGDLVADAGRERRPPQALHVRAPGSNAVPQTLHSSRAII